MTSSPSHSLLQMGQTASQACHSGSEESLKTADTSLQSDEDSSSDDGSALSSIDSSTSLESPETGFIKLTNDEEEYESRDDDDTAPKSKRVIITDYLSTDGFKDKDTDCGPFTKRRATDQKRVQTWNCGCELITALLKTEGSVEPGGIGLAIVFGHGEIIGNEQYLHIPDKSTCKRCIAPIPLWKVMAALNSTKRNIACALFSCRSQERESGDDNPVDSSSLATRFVSLLQPCGAGSVHYYPPVPCIAFPTQFLTLNDPTRLLMLKTLYECKAVREAMDSLHGQFSYHLGGQKVNETPIEVHMHKDWMRNEETNEDGFAPPKRPKLEELSSHEKLQALFAIYKSDPSHEGRCHALQELRFLVAVFWDEIPTDLKETFLNDILKAFATEKDGKLMSILVEVTVQAVLSSIDRKTGFQTWYLIGRFIENSLNSDNVSLKMSMLSILEKAPNLFGNDIESPLSIMKTTLNDANRGVQSAAIKWLLAYLDVDETGDLSPLIPIVLKIAEMRLIDAEKDNEFSLIGSIEELIHKYPNSSPVRSVVSVVKKGLQSHASELLKKRLLSSLVVLTRHTASVAFSYHESLPDIVVIIECCSLSTSARLKKYAFKIIRETSRALTSDPIAATNFFKKLLEDSNEKVRKCAAALCAKVIERHDPLIPALIKLAENPEEKRGIYYLLRVAHHSIILPYLNDFITLCTTIIGNMKVPGKRISCRFFNALCLLRSLFEYHWTECSAILGINGVSQLLKQLTKIEVSLLTEEKAKTKKWRIIYKSIDILQDLMAFFTLKDETRTEALRFVEECSRSTNESLKKFALKIVRNDKHLVEFSEAPSFFAELLSDSSVRSLAASVFLTYTERQKRSGHSVEALLNLLPLLFQAIDSESTGNWFSEDILEFVKTHPELFAKDIRTLVECFIRVEIGSDQVWEENTRQLNKNTCEMKRRLTALMEPNALQTAIDVVHSFMQKENWKERCMGLHGLVTIAKEGYGSMEEHMVEITPLLKDPSPRVRSIALLALGEIADHSWSKFTEHDMVILPLISALNDEDHNVGAHVFYVLSNNCPKENLLSHITPLLDGIIEYTQKEMNRIGKRKEWRIGQHRGYSEDSHLKHILSIVYKLTVSAEDIAPIYDKIMNLLKSFLVHRLEIPINVQYVIGVLKCISRVGGIVGKETFFPAVEEVVHLLAAKADILKWEIFDEIADFCTMLGSHFAPLLPLVMNGILDVASLAPRLTKCPCGMCPDYEMSVPRGRPEADSALILFAQTLGKSFAPYVDKVFKTALLRLNDASFDSNCWTGDIFPHLLACLDGIEDKKNLFNKFWPALKLAIENINMNEFSAKAITSITRSMEQLGLEGISKDQIAELCKLITSEVDAIKKRSVEGNERQDIYDDDSEMDSDEEGGMEKRKRDRRFEIGDALSAIKDIYTVGGLILGTDFINGLPQDMLMEDDGVVESKEDSDSDGEKGTAIM